MKRSLLGSILLFAGACSSGAENAQPTPGIFAALGEPMPRATPEQLKAFEQGRKVAERRFTPADGLGPTFNVVSCAGCHEKPVVGGGAGHYRDFLLTGSLQPDGSFVSLGKNGVQDQYALAEPVRVPSPEDGNHTASRNPIPFFGAGALAAIDDDAVLANADPEDRDGDGISGRPNYDRGYVGRFGVKAQTVSIEKFIRGPLMNHLGVTTNPLSDALKAKLPVPSAADEAELTLRGAQAIGVLPQAQVAAPEMPTKDMDAVPDPEMSEQDLFDLVSFAMLLAAPLPDALSAEAKQGQALFEEVGCAACHVPSLDGPDGLVPAFSDLLLHDMGDALADGITMGEAKGNEFRTAPLWGVSAIGPFMHDGRADTLDAAIGAHGGEADKSRKAYARLSSSEQERVLTFLTSLGGRSQLSEGLLLPDAALPDDGAYGAPLANLNATQRARFARAQQRFDRDVGLKEGLGPRFNGDSCRACHFLGAVGGAGPADVDVTRQGLIDDLGRFNPPDMGTMAHRHAIDGTRPPIDAKATLFERRQTPQLFGAGLLELIADETILAREDPDDLNGDGVRGRAHVLADGRLGRFGWKANVPTLADFARDALSNELGLTLPESDSLFGITSDDDAIEDPEVDEAAIAEIVFFMQNLAPPPRTHGDVAAEKRGAKLFVATECSTCHVPSLQTAAGMNVPLYSDLLLHDVVSDDYIGIGDGTAASRELRTPPLWGLASSTPYLHDASAITIEQAIAAHESEGKGSRLAVEALSATERADLLAFLSSL